jgi:hypothetical protein
MRGDRPIMVLRARVKPEARDAFLHWFRRDHLAEVANIPGVVAVRSGHTAGGTFLGLYTFESSDTVQTALGSPEAIAARAGWEAWAPRLDELFIELWAPMSPIAIFHSLS